MSGELLVPRKGITYKQVEGRFLPLTEDVPELLRTPLVRSQGGSILGGHESGYRSGLIVVDGQLYKLKGCRPEEGERRSRLFGTPVPGPLGTHILGLAQFEAQNTLERREYFLSQGWEYPIEPIGFWAYDNFKYEGETTGATIYRVKGDTRLDELIWYLEGAPLAFAGDFDTEVSETLYKVGLRTGRALKTFHNGQFTWDWDEAKDRTAVNAHYGNVIIFPNSQGEADSGLVDFDNSIRATEPSEAQQLKLVQEGDLELFLSHLRPPAVSTPIERFPSSDVAADIARRMFERAVPELVENDRYLAARRLVRELEPDGSTQLYDMVRIAAGWGYREHTKDSDALTWTELSGLVGRVNGLRQNLRSRVLEYFGGNLDREKILELARQEIAPRL